MSSYYELLKHPLWQKKRLEIMERDEFACCECGSKEKTLAVHHRWYEKGRKPWEYDDDVLVTLCDECHKETELLLSEIRRAAGSMDAKGMGCILGRSASYVSFASELLCLNGYVFDWKMFDTIYCLAWEGFKAAKARFPQQP